MLPDRSEERSLKPPATRHSFHTGNQPNSCRLIITPLFIWSYCSPQTQQEFSWRCLMCLREWEKRRRMWCVFVRVWRKLQGKKNMWASEGGEARKHLVQEAPGPSHTNTVHFHKHVIFSVNSFRNNGLFSAVCCFILFWNCAETH